MTKPAIIAVCIVAIAVIYALGTVLYMWRLILVSKHLIEMHVPFDARLNNGSPRIAVLGDSTALGIGATPEGSVIGHFAVDFAGGSYFLQAQNGLKVGELNDLFPPFAEKSFDLILLQIGANDILRATPIKDFEDSLRRVFQKAKRAGVNVAALHSGNIGLAPFFPWPLDQYMSWQSRRYRNVYRRVAAEEGVIYVDLYQEADSDPLKSSAEFYAPDWLHLTGSGYGVWYGEIQKALQQQNISL